MAGDDGFLMNSGLAAACEASIKDQCQLNDSVAAYRHGPLLFQNRSQGSDRPVLIWVAVASPMAARPAVAPCYICWLMTIAPRLIWLGAPVRPLLPGLPERFVDSPACSIGAIAGAEVVC